MLQSIHTTYPPKKNARKIHYAMIGTKYQIVIPKGIRQQIKQIKPGSKLGVNLIDEHTIKLIVVPKNWSDINYGKYKKYLRGASLEIEKMRSEWEERLKDLENQE